MMREAGCGFPLAACGSDGDFMLDKLSLVTVFLVRWGWEGAGGNGICDARKRAVSLSLVLKAICDTCLHHGVAI